MKKNNLEGDDILSLNFRNLAEISKKGPDKIDLDNSQDMNNGTINNISENTPIIKPQFDIITGEIANGDKNIINVINFDKEEDLPFEDFGKLVFKKDPDQVSSEDWSRSPDKNKIFKDAISDNGEPINC
jgi:hypothetical protein